MKRRTSLQAIAASYFFAMVGVALGMFMATMWSFY